jgi:glutamyl-tRNA synthetase
VKQPKTRLAPSPTGALHVGNLYAFLVNWAIARQRNWSVSLRIEDIDGPRKKKGASEELIKVLTWAGIDWDGEITYQSATCTEMNTTLTELKKLDAIYHCNLTRKEIEDSLSAPHVYPSGTSPIYRPDNVRLHNATTPMGQTNWRFVASTHPVSVHDEIQGTVSFTTANDFVLWSKDDMPSYQLAVVHDDHHQGITEVVRGNDLLQSAAWQKQIYSALNWVEPRWYHIPLILGIDGKRLAKRHGDSRIAYYVDNGVPIERIIGLIATWTNTRSTLSAMTTREFLQEFDFTTLPKHDILFTAEANKWLHE